MIKEVIENFHQQFNYQPKIENVFNLKQSFSKFIIAGMGGSNLITDLLRIRDPYIDIVSHRNYGLPKISKEKIREFFLIANSYSGNTEETVDFLLEGLSRKLPIGVIASGGKLIDLAKKYSLPYIKMPSIDIQPRFALGFNIKAVVKFLGREDLMKELTDLVNLLKPSETELTGKMLAEKLKGFVPVIYSSIENIAIAYIWKVKLNETGKVPAFYNTFPELNHNEMVSFDIKNGNRELIKNFYLILLKDPDDHPRIKKRMDIFEKLFSDSGLPLETIELNGLSFFHKIFNAIILADWVSYYLAIQYRLEPEKTPIIEDFKKLI